MNADSRSHKRKSAPPGHDHHEFDHAADRLAAVSAVPDSWSLSQTQWRLEQAARDETLFALANGSLGVRGGIEEFASSTQNTFAAGVWERAPIHYHERHFGFAHHTDVRIPVADATSIRIRHGDALIDLAECECLAFERKLDFRNARLERHAVWRTRNGATYEVTAQRFVSLVHPGLVCIRWSMRPHNAGASMFIESGIRADRTAAAQGEDPRLGAGSGIGLHVSHSGADAVEAWIAQGTQASGIGVVCAQRHRTEGADFVAAETGTRGVHQVFVLRNRPDPVVTIEKYIAYAWSQPHSGTPDSQLLDQARKLLDSAVESGFDAMARAHVQVCENFWAGADLAIEADSDNVEDERALRFNVFHVMQAACRDGTGGIPAKGLTGEGYEGHVFWDSETFVLPALAFIAPALVKPSLVWRYHGLDRARAHAREMNQARGALYPWRTIDGDECSSHYPSGSAQYHINAAIAFAIRTYVDVTDDQVFLRDMGAEMLAETARIWLQVGHFNARRGGAFCINSVTGPDEYTALVDNNYYTNRMAQEHLRYAVGVLRGMAARDSEAYAALARRLALSDDEIAGWLRAADAMYLPFDERLGIVAQDDTFLDKPVWDFAGTPPEKYPLLMHHHPLTLYRHQVCKQADAVLALVLAGDDVDAAVKRRSFDYYDPITVHDSTLSTSTFAVLAAEVGYPDKAQRFFYDALLVDLDDLHANTSHGAHIAAMAGSWLALSWGFGGLRIEHAHPTQAQLRFDPMLPPAWRGYRFVIRWQGRRVNVTVNMDGATYTLQSGMPLQISHAGELLELRTGELQHRPLRKRNLPVGLTERVRFPQPFKALIFDLDGVIADTAGLHFAAWKRLAGELDLPWDDRIGEKLKGVDRKTSLDIVLGEQSGRYSDAEKQQLADRKNGYYRKSIESMTAGDLLPNAREALVAARSAGLKTALASASRSAGELAQRMQIAELFDHIVDAASVTHAKPDPEIFQRAAAALGVQPAACLGIEDAQAGIAAIKSAGMAALGIGDAQTLSRADAVLPNLTSFDLKKFVVTS